MVVQYVVISGRLFLSQNLFNILFPAGQYLFSEAALVRRVNIWKRVGSPKRPGQAGGVKECCVLKHVPTKSVHFFFWSWNSRPVTPWCYTHRAIETGFFAIKGFKAVIEISFLDYDDFWFDPWSFWQIKTNFRFSQIWNFFELAWTLRSFLL